MGIGVSTPSQKHHSPLSCQATPPWINKLFKPLLFRQSPPLYIGFLWPLPPKSQIFQWTPEILVFLSLIPSYLLKVTKFLGKFSQFEFLVMTEKNIFAYKLFLSLNISDFNLFLCENCNPIGAHYVCLIFSCYDKTGSMEENKDPEGSSISHTGTCFIFSVRGINLLFLLSRKVCSLIDPFVYWRFYKVLFETISLFWNIWINFKVVEARKFAITKHEIFSATNYD